MIVGSYRLQLSCQGKQHTGDGPLELTGRNEREYLQQAKERGWFVRKTEQRVFCPTCRHQYKPKDYRKTP